MKGYHWRDGVWFDRLDGGSVTIRVEASADKYFDVGTIPAAEWESIVRAMAPASGEPSGAVVREALDALASLFKQALYVRERDTHGAWLPDWACAECRPDSDLIEDGFRCGFHAAKAVLSANGRLPGDP